jgi:hypothetical protein
VTDHALASDLSVTSLRSASLSLSFLGLLANGGSLGCSPTGGDGGAAANCSPALTRYQGEFHEPAIPAPPDIHLSGMGQGAQLQVNFPASSNAGEQRLTYWMTGVEDLQASVELALGPGSGFGNQATAYVTLFLDGVPAPLTVVGQSQTTVKVDLAGGAVGSFSATVAHDAISDGAHSATFLAWQNEGKPWGSWSFTVLKNGYAFVPPLIEGAAAPPNSLIGVFDGASGQLLYGTYVLSPGGTVAATGILQPSDPTCLGLNFNLGMVAILDDHPIQYSGAFVHVVRATPGHSTSIPVDISGLPMSDGLRHYLSFWMLTGISQYAEAPEGQQSPWFDTDHRLAIATWGP